MVAIATSAIQMLMLVPGYGEDGSFQLGEWLVVLAISCVLSVALLLFAVPKGGVTAGIVLGALGMASVLVFWAGLTLPLAAASAAGGWRLLRNGNTAAGPVVVLALALLATVALVAVIIGDAVATDSASPPGRPHAEEPELETDVGEAVQENGPSDLVAGLSTAKQPRRRGGRPARRRMLLPPSGWSAHAAEGRSERGTGKPATAARRGSTLEA